HAPAHRHPHHPPRRDPRLRRTGRRPQGSARVAALGMPVVPPRGSGNLRRLEKLPDAARQERAHPQLRRNIGKATHTNRAKRLNVTGELPDWEQLRDAGAAVKTDVLNRLPELLVQLEEAVTARGGVVHWAADAAEANAIVTDLIRK